MKYTRQQVFDKYGGKCAYCGCDLPLKGWHNDHLQPVVRNLKTGAHEFPERDCLDNCMPACASCNINKHSMSLEHFREAITGYVRSLNLRMVQYKMAKKYGLVVEIEAPVVFYFEKITPAPHTNF